MWGEKAEELVGVTPGIDGGAVWCVLFADKRSGVVELPREPVGARELRLPGPEIVPIVEYAGNQHQDGGRER